MIEILQPLIKQFMPFAQEKMGFKNPPKLFLKNDDTNAKNPLGKTAYYDPEESSITLYITKRHPKDVMRSLSHELVHHTQNCRGEFDNVGEMGDGYAQNDEHLREMEREAYETGNMCFRDWEDSIKQTIYYEHLQKGDKRMSTKDWKNKELTTLLSEAWGFKFNSLQEFDEFNGTGEVQEEAADDAEVQEEGGAAARAGNEEKDQGRDRMHADRVHEETTDEDAEVQEEGEKKPDADGDGVPDWADKKDGDDNADEKNENVEAEQEEQITEEAEEEDEDTVEENSTEDLKEAIKKLLTKHLKG
jgi:hypothetical protein